MSGGDIIIPMTDRTPTEDGIAIEIGGGEYPRSGYYHVDVRHGMPYQDVQANILALPFKDNSIAEILSIAMLEHIDWQIEVEQALGECYRILRPGGMFKCYTLNLRTMARRILNNELPWRIVLNWTYGGRLPYKENWHKGAFDRDYMTEILEKVGFQIVVLEDEDNIWVEAVKPPLEARR